MSIIYKFDINFLYDSFKKILDIPFSNDFIDTMRLSRKAFPEMNHHRLTDMVTVLNIPQNNFHRALSDCYSTLACYEGIFNYVNKTDNIDDFINSFRKKSNKSTDLHTITTENTEFDETHPLFGKRCVFTGTLEKMKRADAAQIVVDLGGFCDNGVTKKTNYLILGNNDYCKTIKDGKSSKQKKAEEYKLCGIDIDIIPENVFYDMIDF